MLTQDTVSPKVHAKPQASLIVLALRELETKDHSLHCCRESSVQGKVHLPGVQGFDEFRAGISLV